MQRGPERKQPIPGATTSARTTPIATAAAASGMAVKRGRAAHSSPMRSASMTWSAMSLSGSRIAPTANTSARRRMARLGLKAAIAMPLSSHAAPGTRRRTASAPRTATGAPPTSGATILASGLPGRLLHLESLFLCLLSLCSLGFGAKPQSFLEGVMNEHFKRTGPAVEAHYQFLLWLVPTVDRFPKSQKFVFGDRVLNLARYRR